jgi:murein DD-endopeptidase MepM/ murein hydrolase activator NlpD
LGYFIAFFTFSVRMLEMFVRKYRINPETLRYEEVKLTPKKRLFLAVITGVLLLVTAVGMRVLYDSHSKSPRLAYYEEINSSLRQEYQELYHNLVKDEQLLSDFRRKDDRLYRSVFGMDPIPASIREAGTGGAVMHSALQSISDPDMVIEVFEKVDKVLIRARIQSSSFEDLTEAAVTNQQVLASKPLINPLSPADQYWLTSTFGYRLDPFTKQRRVHRGIDLAGQHGLHIHATGDGKVVLVEYNRYGYGNEVLIDHGFGYTSRYAHLQDILVKPGDNVRRGQVIGTLGSSGRSTGPHLHYEIAHNNIALNPMFHFYEDITPEEYEIMRRRTASE